MPCCCMNDFASLSTDFTTPHFSADLPDGTDIISFTFMFLLRGKFTEQITKKCIRNDNS